MIDGIQTAGMLVEFVRECAQKHGATPGTEIFVRDGTNGPMKRIAAVKMGADQRGSYIVLETSAILVS